MAIIAQVRAFEHINFNKNCGVDEFTEDFLVSDAAMNPETESGRFACAKRPYGRGRRTRTLLNPKTGTNGDQKSAYLQGFSSFYDKRKQTKTKAN